MLGAHLGLGLRIGFVRPATEKFLAELAQFLDHALLGGVGIGAVGHRLVERVQKVVQACLQLGPVRQAFFERARSFGITTGQVRFIVHQPLCL